LALECVKSNKNEEIMVTNEKEILELIPSGITSPEEILHIIKSGKIKSNHIALIKSLINCNNTTIAFWLNIDIKIYRKYISSEIEISNEFQEHIVMLLSVIKHGINFWRSEKDFRLWLLKENFYLDWKKPSDYLNTISGICFIDTMLTNMEYGNNA